MSAARAYRVDIASALCAANDNAAPPARTKLKLRLAAQRRFDSQDQISRRASITDGADSGNSRSYGYDALGRLTSASGPWGSGSASYNVLNNVRTRTLGSRNITINYDTSKNRVSQSVDSLSTGAGGTGTRTVAYDNRGNVTSLGNLAMVYDYSDQPTNISGTADGVGSANRSFLYDGNLKRVRSIVNGKTTYNVYDASGKLAHVHKVAGGGQALERSDYVSAGGKAIARVVHNGTAHYTFSDHLGSPVATMSGSSNTVQRERYTPFGIALNDPNVLKDQAGFTGHIKDSATGLNYMQARYYDPVMGRFLSIDAMDFMGSGSDPRYFNRYMYSANDPVNLLDPNGDSFMAAMQASMLWNHGTSAQTKATVHTALDVGGLVPGFGEVADLANGALYAAEGDFKNAAISGAALIPVVGSAGTVARLSSKVCCFVAGTLVETEYGLRPIEEIQKGDLVWARDEETGEEALKPVLGLIRLHDRIIWDLETVSETGQVQTFGTTDDHPWWVDGHGWKRTDELSPEDVLVTLSGETVNVLSTTNTNVIKPTFNFEVADFNTYFVGESKIWVHNAHCNLGSAGGSRAGKKHTRAAVRDEIAANASANGGKTKCVTCGVNTTPTTRRTAGSTVAPTEGQGAHIKARANGGNGATVKDRSNVAIQCASCNNKTRTKDVEFN